MMKLAVGDKCIEAAVVMDYKHSEYLLILVKLINITRPLAKVGSIHEG